MYCDKCGADNAETAKFCRKCGAEFEGEVETRVAVRGSGGGEVVEFPKTGSQTEQVESLTHEDEKEIFSISPTLVFVKIGYVLAAIAALIFVALGAILISSISTIVWVFIGLLFFLVPAFFHVKQRLTRFTLTETKIEIDSGLIARTTRNIPIRRIQDVTVQTSIIQRLVGFGDLVIDNASDQAGKIVLKNIDSPQKHADILLKQMRLLER